MDEQNDILGMLSPYLSSILTTCSSVVTRPVTASGVSNRVGVYGFLVEVVILQ